MKHLKIKSYSIQNDRLAEFTDQALAGKIDQPASSSNDELRGLEETILRLKRTIPKTELDEATVKQMQARLNARLRKEKGQTELPFWQKWFRTSQPRLKITFAFSALAVLIFSFFIAPTLTEPGSSVLATATMPSPFVLTVAVLSGVTLYIIWVNHRK